jgi:hypothetical protein
MLLFVQLHKTHSPLAVDYEAQTSEVLVALSTKLNDLLALVPEAGRVQEASQMFFLTLLALLPLLSVNCFHVPLQHLASAEPMTITKTLETSEVVALRAGPAQFSVLTALRSSTFCALAAPAIMLTDATPAAINTKCSAAVVLANSSSLALLAIGANSIVFAH